MTRARAQSGALAAPLRALGAEVVEIPTVEVRDPDSWEALDRALQRAAEFDFLILTSVNGVEKLMERVKACGLGAADLAHLEVGAIGPATAAALGRAGLRVSFVPREYRAEGLLEALAVRDLAGKRFLIPRARVARDVVPRVLAGRGARVEVVEAYYTALPKFGSEELRRLLTPPPHLVTFTSSSTASNFARLVQRESGLRPSAFAVASIGPITTATARQLGFVVVLEAAEFTIPALVERIREYFEGGG